MVSFYNILGHRLNKEDIKILTHILNAAWNINITPDIMSKRLNSKSLFIIAKDKATKIDKDYLKEINLDVNHKTIPVGIIETIDMETGGDYSKVPNYNQLTNKGEWRKPLSTSDTIILVDITLLPTRKGKDLGKQMMDYTKNIVQKKHIWTYTPDVEKIKNWHKKLGAKDSKHKIPHARPFFSYPDVNIMDYTKAL